MRRRGQQERHREDAKQRLRRKMFEKKPFVSVVTPTYNRRPFIKQLIKYYRWQTYPLDKIEFLILDDGSDPIEDIIIAEGKGLNIKYNHNKVKLPIGKKRNMLNQMATGKFIICMDDDDYYPPNRVEHAVERLIMSGLDLAGSSLMHTYFINEGIVKTFGPYGPNHATCGTMAYRHSYTKNNKFQDDKKFAEETSFTQNKKGGPGFQKPLVQLDSLSSIICIAHNNNTFSKNNVAGSRVLKEGPEKFIDEETLKFYQNVSSQDK